MSRADLAQSTCTVARTVEMTGDPWTLMILREMFLGGRRFDDIQRQTGAAPGLLSGRLKRLEEIGMITRVPYCERPLRHEYRLTTMGRDFWPVIIALKNWGDNWLADGPAPVEITHKSCGHVITPTMACPDCGEPMAAHDAAPRLSPAFHKHRQSAGS